MGSGKLPLVTGAEIAAASAAAKAAKVALGDDDSITKELAAAAKSTPGFQAAAELRGRRLAAKQQAVLNLFRPLYRLLGVSRDYFDGKFPEDFAEKVADIPEESLTAPRASVAMPAMQGLGWSLDEPNLKEMYLNLLATAADARRSKDAHPSFAEIIKQLSPEEARLLSALFPELSPGGTPIVRALTYVDKGDKSKGFVSGQKHIMALVDTETRKTAEEPMVAVWIDNWVRLGLVEVDYNTFRVGEEAYNWAEERPEIIRLRASVDRETSEVEVGKGLISITSFGARFRDAVTASGPGASRQAAAVEETG